MFQYLSFTNVLLCGVNMKLATDSHNGACYIPPALDFCFFSNMLMTGARIGPRMPWTNPTVANGLFILVANLGILVLGTTFYSHESFGFPHFATLLEEINLGCSLKMIAHIDNGRFPSKKTRCGLVVWVLFIVLFATFYLEVPFYLKEDGDDDHEFGTDDTLG